MAYRYLVANRIEKRREEKRDPLEMLHYLTLKFVSLVEAARYRGGIGVSGDGDALYQFNELMESSSSDGDSSSSGPSAVETRYLIIDIVSIVCSLITIVTYFAFRPMRRHPINLLFWIQGMIVLYFSIDQFSFLHLKVFVITSSAVCDLCYVAAYIASVIDPSLTRHPNTFCTVQTVVGEFFGMASMSWCFLVSFNLYITLRFVANR